MRLFLALCFALAAAPALAQTETITLSQPITFAAPSPITGYEFVSFHYERIPVPKVVLAVHATGSPTQTVSVEYPKDCMSPDGIAPPVCSSKDTAAEVAAVMQQLNTGNHTVTSLWRKVLNAACTDFPLKFPNCINP